MRAPRTVFAALALFASMSLGGADDPAPALAVPPATATEDDYIRFLEPEGRPAKLQTAVASYRRPDGVKVDVIGVVHIADESYYKALNEAFKAYDALLYEMVGADPDKPVTKEMLREGDKRNPLRFFQLLVAGMLDVRFQLDQIDYTAANFVHADMDMATFQKRQAEKGENLFSLVEEGYKAQQEAGGDGFDFSQLMGLFSEGATPASNKLALGRQFHNIEGLFGGMGGEDGSVLVAERNLAALDVMTREIESGKENLAIFYGAAHLPDFDKRLREDHGFERTGTSWFDAWTVEMEEPDAAGASKAVEP